MSYDLYCRMCKEPYMEPRLDMLGWEYELFMKGAGCPCCEGQPEKRWELAEDGSDIHMAAANGDGCPIERLDLFDPEYTPPKWERPADPILWTCKGCGVNVIRNVDDGKLEYHLPLGAKGADWYSSHDYRPEETPAHVFKPDEPVCECCLSHCDHCGGPICGTLEYGDTYDDGNSFSPDWGWNKHYCIDCFEQLCEHCHDMPDECDCYCGSCGELTDECNCHCEDCGELTEDCSCFGDDEEDENDE